MTEESGDNGENNLANRVIEMRNQENPPSQQEVADELGISQSHVSRLENAYQTGTETGREQGKEEGFKEAMDKVRNFEQDDETEKPEEDTYWCAYCEAENDSRVEVEYLADSCPNGHDLTGDWPEA